MSPSQPAAQRPAEDITASPCFQAGLEAAENLPPMTPETARKVAAILAPFLREEIRAHDEGQGPPET